MTVAIAVLGLTALSACSGKDSNDSMFPIEVSEERVNAGKADYMANCATCHGEPGVTLPPLESAPRHDEAGHTWHHADRSLFEWTLDRPPLATTMPAFRGVLTEEQVINILAYIKSTWPENIQQRQREGSQQYEAQIRENA